MNYDPSLMDLGKLATLFKVNNQKVDLSPTQQYIFGIIVARAFPRVICILPTQYGKSFTIAIAVLFRATMFPHESWTIIGPTEKKARIIMRYIIEHVFDSPLFLSQMVYETEDRLKKEESKKRITFRNGSSIEILSLDSRNSKKKNEAAMGMGSQNIIFDEACLVDDELEATVVRMLGGHPDGMLMKVGNPFYRSSPTHFYKSFHSERYHKVWIDYTTAIKEGRFTQDFIDEMKEKPLFDVLYGCKFPDEGEVSSDGFRTLFAENDIKIENKEHYGVRRLGVDVGGGGDETVLILRSDTKAEVINRMKSTDTMAIIPFITEAMQKHGVIGSNVFIDDTGIGRGVSDRMNELMYGVQPVVVGNRATQNRYANIKAELSFLAQEWVHRGGVFANEAFRDILNTRYKIQSDKRIIIEPKDKLRQRIGRSPDVADAFYLTFAGKTRPRAFSKKPSGF